MKTERCVISIIIPTIGRGTLQKTLDCLQSQTRKPDEIIVIEDKDKQGVSWARNTGITQSRGDLIAFTDDDCMPPPEWIETLANAITNHNAAGAGGTYYETDEFLEEIRKRRGFPSNEKEDQEGFVGVGGNVMYSRAWLQICREKDGYAFNELFKGAKGGEDIELAWRMRRYGGKLIFVPCKVAHLRRVGPLSYLKYQFFRGTGIAWLHKNIKSAKTDIPLQKSLLWDKNARSAARFFKIIWHKILGPFDRKSFSTLRRFLLFWLGEKFQGLGYIWGIIG